MPASLVAVAVLLVLFIPGYLFQAGVREYHSTLAAERDLYAIAQAVALSAGGLFAFFLTLRLLEWIGFGWAGSLQDSLLHDPASGEQWNLTAAQEIMLVGLLILPVMLGRRFGKWRTRSDARQQRKKKSNKGPLFPDSPTRQRIRDLANAAERGDIYVRVVRQGEEDVIGLLDRASANATKSPLGQGLAISARWAPDESGAWRQLPGAHIGITGIIDIQRWSKGSTPPPVWAQKAVAAAESEGASGSAAGTPQA